MFWLFASTMWKTCQIFQILKKNKGKKNEYQHNIVLLKKKSSNDKFSPKKKLLQ
jgi:hypothetical protein